MSTTKWPRKITVGHASVTVYRNREPDTKSGFIYVLAWNTPTGRKREKFAVEGEALQEGRNKAKELAQGRIDPAAMSAGDREELHAARELAAKIPLLSAMKEWAKAREITQGHIIVAAEQWASRNRARHERRKVADVATEFLAAKSRAGIATEKNHGHIFADLKRDFGEQYIDVITAPMLQAWFDRWPDPSTRNTFRKHIVGLWRWAQRQGYLTREARTEAEQTDRAKEPPAKKGIIGPETLRALFALIRTRHPHYIAPLAIAAFCGLRRSEVHAQRWEQIDLAARRLEVSKAKEGTPAERHVPLPRAAVSWLMLCPDRTGEVCGNLAIDRIRDIGREADFELPENCFRHSWITYRATITQNVPQTAEEAGNSPAIIRRHYKKLVLKSSAREWFAVSPDGADVIDITEGKAANA